MPRGADLRAAVLIVCAMTTAFACRGAESDQPPGAHAPSSLAETAADVGPPPTFNKDIAPILFANCAPCHRPGQVAPFPLLTYADAKPRAEKIAAATRAGRMPPWLPELEATPVFVGERRLSSEQVARIQRWEREGAAEGNPADLPATPAWPEGWETGKPDLVLTLPRPYVLKPAPDGQGDLFRNIVLRVSLPATRYVRAVEFRPGAVRVIHHAVITVDRTRSARRRDGADGQVGYDGMIVQEAQNPDGHFIGWTPGRGPIVAADGLQWRLEKGSDLLVQLHLLPGKSAVPVSPTIGLFFTDTPPARTPLMVKLGSKAIDIPAGQADYAIADSYTLPVDVDLVSLYPHAHYLGREMSAEATLPDGTKRRLLHIPEWSFHWQQDYRFVTPLRLPRGTTVSMRYTYDNSSGNRFNRSQPPRPVRYGANSSDEMGDLWLQVLPHSAADAARLASEFQQRDALASVAGAEMLVRYFPDDPKHLTFLGGSYAQVGRLAEAAQALEKALKLDPQSADAHNYLGGVRLAERRLPDVIAHFTRAAELAPDDERMHFNLGNVLNAAGRPDDAARSFRRALAINPDFGNAHQNVGVYLASERRFTEALVHLRRAAELSPDSVQALTDLASVLAEVGQSDEARRLFQRAIAIRPEYALARENLARLDAPH